MAYTLKATPFGAGTTPTFCFMRDLDQTGSNLGKDYASSAITTDLSVGSNCSPQTLASYGAGSDKTLYGIRTTSDTTNGFITFGTNKPSYSIGAANLRTIVIIGNAVNASVSAAYLMGSDTTDGNYVSLGSTSVLAYKSTFKTTTLANRTATRTYGLVLDSGTDANSKIWAADAGGVMANVTSGTPSGVNSLSYTLSYLGRLNSVSTSMWNGDIFLVAFFDVALSEANLNSIHADPYGSLLDGGASAVKKIKLMTHSSAASASAIEGWVLNAAKTSVLGTFTGKAFGASLEGGQAVLKVSCAAFGDSTLTTSDTVNAVAQNSLFTTGLISGTVIEEP